MILWLLLAGCPSPEDPDPWGLLAGPFGEAVLLSAWSDGDVALIVGGDLHGGEASLVRVEEGVPCQDESPAERALWWIHGPGPGEWYAVGEAGVVVHAVGEERFREDVETDATLFGVWAEGDVVWAVGGHVATGTGEIWRRDEDGWAPFATDLPGVLFKVWQDWFVGAGVAYRLEDGDLVAHPPPEGTTLTTVRGRGPDDVWAVGGVGTVMHWDGAWTAIDNPFGAPVNGLWTAPGEPVWVTGAYGAQGIRDGDQWEIASPPVTGETFHAVWPHGDQVLFVGGNFFGSGPSHGVIGIHAERWQWEDVGACP